LEVVVCEQLVFYYLTTGIVLFCINFTVYIETHCKTVFSCVSCDWFDGAQTYPLAYTFNLSY